MIYPLLRSVFEEKFLLVIHSTIAVAIALTPLSAEALPSRSASADSPPPDPIPSTEPLPGAPPSADSPLPDPIPSTETLPSAPGADSPLPDPIPSTETLPSAPGADSPPPNPALSIDTPPEPSPADDTPADTDRWRVMVEPYFFVPFNVRANATVAGREASVEADLGDILNFNRVFAAALRLEAQRNRLGFILDSSYFFVGDDRDLSVTLPAAVVQQFGIPTDVQVDANADVEIRQGIVDLAAFYRVVDMSLSSPESGQDYPRLVVEPILGGRLIFLGQDLELDSIRLNNAITLPAQTVESNLTLLQPLIGARLGLAFSPKWAVGVRGDVSGFNIDAERNLSWNLLVGTQYQLSNTVGLQLAYRFTEFDYRSGEGLEEVGLDVEQNGLWLGVSFRF